jgi:hypothetical protein
VNGPVLATARFSQHAAADGNGAWIVSTHPARLFSRNQAIMALVLAERLANGYGDDDPKAPVSMSPTPNCEPARAA